VEENWSILLQLSLVIQLAEQRKTLAALELTKTRMNSLTVLESEEWG